MLIPFITTKKNEKNLRAGSKIKEIGSFENPNGLENFLLKNGYKEDTSEIVNLYEFCRNNVYDKVKRRSGGKYTQHINRMLYRSVKDGFANRYVVGGIISHDYREESRKLKRTEKVPFVKSGYSDFEKILSIMTKDDNESKEDAMIRIINSGIPETLVIKSYDIYDNSTHLKPLNDEAIMEKLKQTYMLMGGIYKTKDTLIDDLNIRKNGKSVLIERLKESEERFRAEKDNRDSYNRKKAIFFF